MSYLDTPHKKKSLAITVLIHVLLLLLLFLVGFAPKEDEYDGGIAINFGNTEVGSGKRSTTSIVKTAPKVVPSKPVATPVAEEKVITQESVEAPVIKPKQEAKTNVVKEKTPIKTTETNKTEATPEKPVEKQPNKSTLNMLNSLIGAKSDGKATEGDGNENKAGNKGNPEGSVNAKSYYGTGKGLDGDGNYRLGGRKALNKEKNVPECNKTGTVVVQIMVNQQGEVVKATPGVKGSTETAPCLLEPAKRAAMATKFNSDPNAPTMQVGSIVYTFKLSQ